MKETPNKKQTAMQQLLSELHLRLVIINSEPNGIVRETMIQNFLIDELQYLEMEKEQMIDDYINGMHKGNELPAGEHMIKLDVNTLSYSIELAQNYIKETYGE